MLGGVSYSVASQLARDMKTTPDFIQAMCARPPEYVELAAYVRNVTPTAIKLTIPIGLMEKEPTITEIEWKRLRERNRERYGARSVPSDQAAAPPATTKRSANTAEQSRTPPAMEEKSGTDIGDVEYDTEH
jgi:hypothetical protein